MITPTRLTRHVIGRNVRYARTFWWIVLSGFIEPLLYLGSIGVGLGSLVGSIQVAGESVGYVEFLAPALLATSAMNGAVYEVHNVFWKMNEQRIYLATLATPVGVGDVAMGEVTWAVLRGTSYSIGFLLVVAAGGLVTSWWGLALLPAAMLVSALFASVSLIVVAYARTWNDMEISELLLLPFQLFSATFVPIATYPMGLQIVVRCTPLYHGVVLLRSLSTGIVGWSTLGHVLYLVVFTVVAYSVATRRMARVLTE